MNLGKVMKKNCEMGREANEIFYVKFLSYKCPSLGKFEKGKLPFTCEGSHDFFAQKPLKGSEGFKFKACTSVLSLAESESLKIGPLW